MSNFSHLNGLIEVIKCDINKIEMWRYSAIVLEAKSTFVIVSATFNRPSDQVGGLYLEKGDRFIELYTSQHWYNIYEVHAGDTSEIKGWYCNVACPARSADHSIIYIDLALDLVITKGGIQQVMDMDEFNTLDLNPVMRTKALAALNELQCIFQDHPDGFQVMNWSDTHG